MHDNKRLGEKLTTWGWWLLTLLPTILMIGLYIKYIIFIPVAEGLQPEQLDAWGQWFTQNYQLQALDLGSAFGFIIPEWLTEATGAILFNIGQYGEPMGSAQITFIMTMMMQLAWAIWINILHICYDFLTLLFKMAHNFFRKVGK